MKLDWLLNPMMVYAIAAAGLLTALALFVSMKREMAKSREITKQTQAAHESGELAVRVLETELQTLRDSVRNLEAVPTNRPTGMSLNLTKRAQALRMHRRGEPIPGIAAALETPAIEVALMLKVQALTNETREA